MTRVAFYAPMKPPDHPAPSGDREIARLLMAALRRAGYDVELASTLRTYLRDRDDDAVHGAIVAAAREERARIAGDWRRTGAPDLWVSYHPYYKSPDLLGPGLCREFRVPWVTVEASQSARRSVGHWADFQARALDAVRGARVNIGLTHRDIEGLFETDASVPVAYLGPFFDADPFLAIRPRPEANHLVTVAMMRAGDKIQSFGILAEALARLGDTNWRLTVVGDGPAREEVHARFAALPADRVTWAGEQDRDGIVRILSRGAVYVWPGCGEAFGLAYLEAQAAQLPVAALAVAGVPEVVHDGETGLLGDAGDPESFATAIRRLLSDETLRARLGAAGRERVGREHGIGGAARRLAAILDRAGAGPGR